MPLSSNFLSLFLITVVLCFAEVKALRCPWYNRAGSNCCPSLVTLSSAGTDVDVGQDLTLEQIASKLRMRVFDADENIFGIDSKDNDYGIEVVNLKLHAKPSLGISLTEMASGRGTDHRGLVLVDGVSEEGSAFKDYKEGRLKDGDVIIAVVTESQKRNVERVEGLNLDETVGAIQKAIAESNTGFISLSLKRLVRRQVVEVEVCNPQGDSKVINVLCGSNLRMALLQQGMEIYDPHTKRYDQPYITGDCGGEGICGTCTLAVLSDKTSNKLLSEPDTLEKAMMSSRGNSWRLACRSVVGPENRPGKLKILLRPQQRGKNVQ